jgi:hypothetical protein
MSIIVVIIHSQFSLYILYIYPQNTTYFKTFEPDGFRGIAVSPHQKINKIDCRR